MSTSTILNKTDFIKFNVSTTFKKIVSKKAHAMGMTLSELGRMLFGAYAHDVVGPKPSKKILRLAAQAMKWHKQGKGKTFTNIDEMNTYLDSLSKS